MIGEKMFEFFDAEKTKLTLKEKWSKEASKFEIQDSSEYEKLLDDFAESDKIRRTFDTTVTVHICPALPWPWKNMSRIKGIIFLLP